MIPTKVMDHKNYPKSLKDMSLDQLNFIIHDCKEAIAANPDNPNNSYYMDEIAYCSNEKKRRLDKRS